MKKLALLSVSDKTNIIDLAQALSKHDYQIIATGKTAKVLSDSGLKVVEISSITNFPEIFDGREKLFIEKYLEEFYSEGKMKKTKLKQPKIQLNR